MHVGPDKPDESTSSTDRVTRIPSWLGSNVKRWFIRRIPWPPAGATGAADVLEELARHQGS